MMCRRSSISSSESGQVLAAGVFILIILLLLIFAGFDVHNALRARFKIQTAQESAAIAGATWQKHSLNLIGEINLVKACSLLLEGSGSNWNTRLPQRDTFFFKRSDAIQARIDILTEMQTRVSFIGPLIGFAAAQQAAKANGIVEMGDLEFYLEDLKNNIRYQEQGGVKKFINNYEWRTPYMELVRTISQNKISVFPNTTAGSNPRVDPPQLGDPNFYQTILLKNEEITKANGEAIYPQTGWGSLKDFVYRDRWAERFANPPWWDIDFNSTPFPNESEIFTLGVGTAKRYPESGSDAFEKFHEVAKQHLSKSNADALYGANNTAIPSIDMFCYKQKTWDPEYLRHTESDYESAFYNYWFKGTVMRKNVKKRYIYEGPAAYVETYTNVDKASSLIKISGQKTHGDRSIRVGSKRDDNTVSLTTSYRPGAIAKALGSLNEDDPPTALPLVLPVFDKVIIMPTYMPIPYGFSVLRDYRSLLRTFLAWLSTQRTLDDASGLPSGCAHFLEALRILVKGPEFRYYGWNPNFDEAEFDKTWHHDLEKWHSSRVKEPSKYQYNTKSGTTLPGYYQEPNIFTACPKTKKRDGIVTVPTFDSQGNQTGTAERHFINSKQYMVVNSKKHIITRVESDPTFDPKCCTTNYTQPSSSSCNCGNCSGHYVTTSGVSTQHWYGL